jgi:antitoxin YefM
MRSALAKVLQAAPNPNSRASARVYDRRVRIASLTDLKAHLSEYADKAERGHERFLITRHGRASFVIMGVGDLETLEDTVFWLSQPGVRGDVAAARTETAVGGGMTKSELHDFMAQRPPSSG